MDVSTTSDTRAAYDALAPVYDGLTAHHDHERWLAQLLDLACRHGLAGTRALDVACGTGKSFMPLVRRGWEVTACDLSPTMAARARRRARGHGVQVRVADMRRLPVLCAGADLVTCLDDAVNYCSIRASCAPAWPVCARTCARAGCSCSTSTRWPPTARSSARASAGATVRSRMRRSASLAQWRPAGCSPRRSRPGEATRCWRRAATCSATTARASCCTPCAAPASRPSSCTAARPTG